MKLLAKQTAAMLAGLIMLMGSQAANAAKENQTINGKLDINAAQLAGKTASQTEKGVSATSNVATKTASLKIAAQALVATQSVSTATVSSLVLAQSVIIASDTTRLALETPVEATATTSPVVASMALIASLPVALPAAKAGKATASQVINTLYPDPTSSSFPHKGAEAADSNYKTAAEIIEEFNQKAAEIASETAMQMSEQEQVPESVIEEMPSEGQVASLTWPDSEQDPEFIAIASQSATADPDESAATQANPDLQTTEDLQTTVDSQALLDFETSEESPASAGLQTSSDSIVLPASAIASGSATAPTLYNKIPALEPSLMVKGVPVDEQCLLNDIDKLTGRLVPEKQPLGRRHHLYRWVLKTEDGQRVPLKSNLKLLQEVRNDKLLDGNVTLTGRFISSGFNKELRYFIIESAVPAVATVASGTSGFASVATSSMKVTTSDALPVSSKFAPETTDTPKTSMAPKEPSSNKALQDLPPTVVSSGTCKVDVNPLLKK